MQKCNSHYSLNILHIYVFIFWNECTKLITFWYDVVVMATTTRGWWTNTWVRMEQTTIRQHWCSKHRSCFRYTFYSLSHRICHSLRFNYNNDCRKRYYLRLFACSECMSRNRKYGLLSLSQYSVPQYQKGQTCRLSVTVFKKI